MKSLRIDEHPTSALIAVVLGLMLGACALTPQSSAPSSSVASSVVAATASPEPSRTTLPSASAVASSPASETPLPSLRPDVIARVTADGVRVRRDPGPDGEQIATLDARTRVFVLEGPTTDPADPTLDWWLVAPYGCEDGCGYDPRIGWMSSGPAGNWLEPVPIDCRPSYTADDYERFWSSHELLACHGNEPITLEGVLDYWCCSALMVAQVEPAWLAGESTSSYPMLRAGAGDDVFAWGPMLRVDPASGVMLGERGTVGRFTGHFDDPAAQSCVATIAEDVLKLNPHLADTVSPEGSIYACRLQFVVDSVEVLDVIPLPTHQPQG